MSKMADHVYPTDGWIVIWDLPHYGKPYVLKVLRNVVTNNGRQRGVELFGKIKTSTFSVEHIVLGDDGIVQGPPRLLDVSIPASRTDTTLNNQIAKKLASVALSASISNEIIYTAEFLTTDGPFPFFNLSQPVVNEVGLLADFDDLLAARRTFPSIPFDVGDRQGLRFEWHLFHL